jgi:flavin reductase (DIM6/NTAB) family NADH-FMN oxidoreductase RutF
LKVPFAPDKRSWHPSVLPGQIVLVSTVDAAGRANVAPRSWNSTVAAREPVLGIAVTSRGGGVRRAECRAGEAARQHERLQPVFLLEDGLCGELGPLRRIGDRSD